MRLVWLILLVIAGGVAAFLWTRFESDAPAIKTRTARGWVPPGRGGTDELAGIDGRLEERQVSDDA